VIGEPVTSKSKRSRAQLAIAVALVVSACAPQAHRDGTAGGDAANMLRMGDAARDAGDPAAALPLYQRAHRLDRESNVATVRIAQTFNQLGAYHEAGDAWSSMLRLDPRNYDALVGYGITLTALRQPHLALEYFRRAEEIDQSAALFNGVGVANDMLGNAMQAQDAYRRGLELTGNSMQLMNNLGLSLALSGGHQESIETLERVAAMPGAGVRHRQNLALAYALGGFSERAHMVASKDFDDELAIQKMAFYRMIADMRDHAEKVAAVTAQTARDTQTAGL